MSAAGALLVIVVGIAVAVPPLSTFVWRPVPASSPLVVGRIRTLSALPGSVFVVPSVALPAGRTAR